MNNRKGFTLIEIIISIAILGILSIGFLYLVSNNFFVLNKTKELTQKTFIIQQEIEMTIDEIKKGIRDGKTIIKIKDKALPIVETKEFIWKTLDPKGKGSKIKYFEAVHSVDKKYATIVSNIKPKIDTNPLKLESIDIVAKKNLDNVDYIYPTTGFSIIGSFENDKVIESKYNHLLNIVEWYVSSEKFNMPIPAGAVVDENAVYYPLFPRDYTLVRNEKIDRYGVHERKIIDLKAYKGKNIIFTATPGAKSGKIGIQSKSKAIFISGIPITKDLAIHLDANYIDPTSIGNNGEVKSINSILKVNKWIDISSIFNNIPPNEAATANTDIAKPELKNTNIETEYLGQFVKFDKETFLNINDISTRNKDVSIFAVVRNTGNDETTFIKNNTKIVTSTINNTNNGWQIIKIGYKTDSSEFEIGKAKVDIAEIIVFSRKLISTEIVEIDNYLKLKYLIYEANE